MTFEETSLHIEGLKHLVGQWAPYWYSPIAEIIPAPKGDCFLNYLRSYIKSGNPRVASTLCSKSDYDVLLIFSKCPKTGTVIHEWYSHLYD